MYIGNADPATRGFRRNSLSNMIAPGQRFLDPGAGCKDKAQTKKKKKPRYARALALLGRNINSHANIGGEIERTVQRRVRLRSYEMWMAHSQPGELSSKAGALANIPNPLAGLWRGWDRGLF